MVSDIYKKKKKKENGALVYSCLCMTTGYKYKEIIDIYLHKR